MSTIHVLDHQTDQIVDFYSNKKKLFWDDVHFSSLKNYKEYFNFTTLYDNSEHLQSRNRVIIPDEDGFFREFLIKETLKSGKNKEVYTIASFIELKKQKVIQAQTLESQTAYSAIDIILDGTEWQRGQIDYGGIRTITFVDATNPFAALKKMASIFDMELRFRIEVSGNKVVGRYVDVVKKQGTWNGKEITVGKDLIGVKRRETSEHIVTALLCYGPEKEDGTRLEVTVTDEDARKRWGRPENNPQHLWAIYEPQSTDQGMTESRLQSLGETELGKRINAVVEYEADQASIEHVFGFEHEKVRKGDTVRIKDTSYSPPLYLEARVQDLERYPTVPSRKKYILGDYVEFEEADVMALFRSMQKALSQRVTAQRLNESMDATEEDANTYTDSRLTNFVGATTYDSDLSDIRAQIDNQIQTHFYAHEPTLSNLPASNWSTVELRDEHAGDLFFDSTTGYAYRFMRDGTTYSWSLVRDEGITKAIQDAAEAQDTADSKRRVFVSQPTTPYDTGDLWANSGAVYRSVITKTSTATFNSTDWVKIGDVTSENTANDTANVGGRPASDIEDKTGAQAKATAAQQAAEEYALAKAQLAETQAKAYADGVVSKEEQARINQAQADLADAKEHAAYVADTAEMNAKDHADTNDNQIRDNVDSIENRVSTTEAELVQTKEDFNFMFETSGGANLLQNSVGYAGTDFWTATGTVNIIRNKEVETNGSGSAFALDGGTLEQTVHLPAGSYAVSVSAVKDAVGTGYVRISYDDKTEEISFADGLAYNYTRFATVIESQGSGITITLHGSAGSGLLLTDIMLNKGNAPVPWGHAAGEVYNSSVTVNQNGFRVNGEDSYTAVTPREFAGYAMVNGEMTRVFHQNKDTTQMNKAEVSKEISMGDIKAVPIKSAANSGWAFIRKRS